MSEVQSWVFTICAGTLVCGVVSAILPGESFKKTIQMLLGLFMLCCFLAPIGGDWTLPQVDLAAAEEQRQQVAEGTEAHLSQGLEADSLEALMRVAQGVVADYGLEAGEYTVALQKTPDGQVGAMVYLPVSLQAQQGKLQAALEKAFGIPTTLGWMAPPETSQNQG